MLRKAPELGFFVGGEVDHAREAFELPLSEVKDLFVEGLKVGGYYWSWQELWEARMGR